MTSDPSRKEWLATRERLREYDGDLDLDKLTEAAMGYPCPPEPVPPYWRNGGIGSLVVMHHDDGGVWVGFPQLKMETLTSDAAISMADALTEHARYAREVEDPICGHYVSGGAFAMTCQRPKGHPGVCSIGDNDDEGGRV
jgi:hypothetical protein